MIIYIAGPMTGIPDFNRAAFNEAAVQIIENGHVALNPAILPNGLTQPQYMDICCAMLRAGDAIFLLDGWSNSAGARAEKALAEKLNMQIIFQISPIRDENPHLWICPYCDKIHDSRICCRPAGRIQYSRC